MTRRRSQRKKRLTQRATASGDEPPDPITLTTLAVVGTVVGAAGTVMGGISANQNAKYQGMMAESNALAAQRDADWSRSTAKYNEDLARQNAARVRGSQRAAIGASGLGFSGSPLDLLEETAVQSEIEAQGIRAQGEYSAGSAEFGAAGSRLQAGAYRANGRTALTSSLVSAGAGLASGLGSAGYNYKTMKKAGTY